MGVEAGQDAIVVDDRLAADIGPEDPEAHGRKVGMGLVLAVEQLGRARAIQHGASSGAAVHQADRVGGKVVERRVGPARASPHPVPIGDPGRTVGAEEVAGRQASGDHPGADQST